MTHFFKFIVSVYAQICALNMRKNDFKNKVRFTKNFEIKFIINFEKIYRTEWNHSYSKTTDSVRRYSRVKKLYFIFKKKK